MGRHRAPVIVSEKLQHVGWAAFFVWMVVGVVALSCLGTGFVCCLGWRIGG